MQKVLDIIYAQISRQLTRPADCILILCQVFFSNLVIAVYELSNAAKYASVTILLLKIFDILNDYTVKADYSVSV